PYPAGGNDDWRAERQGVIQRLPHLLAGVLVQTDDAGARFAADEQDQEVSFDQRRRRARGKPDVVILLQIPLPEHFARAGVEAEEVPDPSHRVHLAIPDNRCRDGTDLLLRVEGPVLVGDLIGVGPERLAGRLVETVDALLGLGLHHLGIRKVDPALGHDRTREAPPDRDTPTDRQTSGWERFEKTGFSADAIAVRAAPLGPIVRPQ